MGLGDILCIPLLLFEFVFLLRLVLSFFPIRHDSMWGSARSLSVVVTEPVVMPIRRAVPPLPGALGGFGVAELIVLIGLQIIIGIVC